MDDAFRADVQRDVDPCTLDTVYRFDADQVSLVPFADNNAIEKRVIQATPIEQFEHTLAECAHMFIIEARFCAGKGSLHTLVSIGLEYVVERGRFKGSHGMLIKSCHEYGHGHSIDADRIDHAETIESRHLNIEENDVGLLLQDDLDGVQPVLGFHKFADVGVVLE